MDKHTVDVVIRVEIRRGIQKECKVDGYAVIDCPVEVVQNVDIRSLRLVYTKHMTWK